MWFAFRGSSPRWFRLIVLVVGSSPIIFLKPAEFLARRAFHCGAVCSGSASGFFGLPARRTFGRRRGQARTFGKTFLAVGDDTLAGDQALIAGFERDVSARANCCATPWIGLPGGTPGDLGEGHVGGIARGDILQLERAAGTRLGLFVGGMVGVRDQTQECASLGPNKGRSKARSAVVHQIKQRGGCRPGLTASREHSPTVCPAFLHDTQLAQSMKARRSAARCQAFRKAYGIFIF